MSVLKTYYYHHIFGYANLLDILEEDYYLHNQYLAQKTALKTRAYTDGSGINQKIGSACIILGKGEAIKRFLGTDKTSTVYMGEMQGIQDSLAYAIN